MLYLLCHQNILYEIHMKAIEQELKMSRITNFPNNVVRKNIQQQEVLYHDNTLESSSVVEAPESCRISPHFGGRAHTIENNVNRAQYTIHTNKQAHARQQKSKNEFFSHKESS